MNEQETIAAGKGTLQPLVVPDGFRLLETGDRIRKGDLYCKGPGHSWHECRTTGGKWNADGFWPMARRHNAPREGRKPALERTA